MKRILAAIAAALMLSGLSAGVASATVVAGPYISPGNETFIDHGQYMVRSDDFGMNTYLKALPHGFKVDGGSSQKAWSAFPFIGRGCSWQLCTSYWNFPRVKNDGNPTITDYTRNTWKGSYNDSLDIWFSTYKDRNTQNNGTEIMIWMSHPGVSERYDGSVRIDGAEWYVTRWRAHNAYASWNYIAYVKVHQQSSLVSMPLNPFFDNAERQGSLSKNFYWTNIDAGFELDGHGAGTNLAVTYFSEWNAPAHKTAPKPKAKPRKVTPSKPTTKPRKVTPSKPTTKPSTATTSAPAPVPASPAAGPAAPSPVTTPAPVPSTQTAAPSQSPTTQPTPNTSPSTTPAPASTASSQAPPPAAAPDTPSSDAPTTPSGTSTGSSSP